MRDDILAPAGAAPATSGARHVRMPGELGPPPVQVGFDVPAGWETLQALGNAALLAEPQPQEGRATTTIHLSTVRAAMLSVALLAEGATESLADRVDGLQIADERIVTVDGRPAALREYRVSMPGRIERPIVEFGLYVVVEHEGSEAVDGIEVHVTGDGDRRDDVVAVLDGVLATLRLDRVPADA